MLKAGNKTFNPGPSPWKDGGIICASTRKDNSESAAVKGIKINKDVNSIIFLHACGKEATNRKAYGQIYNFEETSELLGWYEIVYEDGFVETVPIRYGINILDFDWRKRINGNIPPRARYSQNRYAWQASAVDCSADKSDPVTFFAYEWENPRLGKQIKEINLNPVNYNKGNENSVILLALSISETEIEESAKGFER